MAGYRIGAVVMLRSGGPAMTIEKIESFPTDGRRYACCHWFDRGRRQYGNFAVAMLDVVTETQNRPARTRIG